MQVTRGNLVHAQRKCTRLSFLHHPTRAWERGYFGPILGSSTSRDTRTMWICSNWLIESSVASPISALHSQPVTRMVWSLAVRWWMVQSKKIYAKVHCYSTVLNAPWVSTLNLTPVLYLQHNYCVFVCSLVHGFVQTIDLELTEGATQQVIRMILDVKGNTLLEPGSTRGLNFSFTFTCIDSSNGGGRQAVGELWMCVGREI